MISYGLGARPALARLMQPYNDIDIYVEDSNYVGVYKKLINRALAGRASVASVTALGPKSIVLDRAYNDNKLTGRPRLYIVDGDFDFVSRKRHTSAPHLYRLNVYSLENLVFERPAIEYIAEISMPHIEDIDAHRAASYNDIENDLNNDLARLFAVHAVAKRLGVTDHAFRIESISVSDTFNGRVYQVNRQKCRSKTLALVKLLKQRKGINRYRSARAVVWDILHRRGISGSAFIPGKEFHLKYLVGRLGRAGGVCLNQKVVVATLAERCTLSRDPRLVRRLRKMARNATTRPSHSMRVS